MNLRRTERFKTAFQTLTRQDRKRVEKALRLMVTDLRHPSLRVKKIKGTHDIFEARASRSIRITFQMEPDALLLRNVGAHDVTLNNP
jgi:mRNA-degrading endonuclease RelE of RelBE toxin-antitoxin system